MEPCPRIANNEQPPQQPSALNSESPDHVPGLLNLSTSSTPDLYRKADASSQRKPALSGERRKLCTLLGCLAVLVILYSVDMAGTDEEFFTVCVVLLVLPSLYLAAVVLLLFRYPSLSVIFLELGYFSAASAFVLTRDSVMLPHSGQLSALPALLSLVYSSQPAVFCSTRRFLCWHSLLLAGYLSVCIYDFVPLRLLEWSLYMCVCLTLARTSHRIQVTPRDSVYTISSTGALESAKALSHLAELAPEAFKRDLLQVNNTIGQLVGRTSNAAATPEGIECSEPLGELLQSYGSDWNFDSFALASACQGHPVVAAGLHALSKQSCIDSTSKETAAAFLRKVEHLYKDNPYHNSTHAVDVLGSFLFLMMNSAHAQSLSHSQRLAMVIANLTHDIGHPSVTNRFLVNSGHEMALTYNDTSVLEMMHASVTFQLLRMEDSDLLSVLDGSEQPVARKLIIDMILATDMAKHCELLAAASTDLTYLFKLCIKAADIGHAAKQWQLHVKWTGLLMQEFFAQGDLEKEQGLPVSFNCDRVTTDVRAGQLSFIDGIVHPLYVTVHQLLQSDQVEDVCIAQLNLNRQNWESSNELPYK